MWGAVLTFMCMVRSSFTTKRFLLHLVHANGFSPWKWRRRKCFFAWYFVANSLPQSWHLTGCVDVESVGSTSGWRGRCVVMWKMRFISRLNTFRHTVHVKSCSGCPLESVDVLHAGIVIGSDPRTVDST